VILIAPLVNPLLQRDIPPAENVGSWRVIANALTEADYYPKVGSVLAFRKRLGLTKLGEMPVFQLPFLCTNGQEALWAGSSTG
jgi:hypothetical protein